MMRQDRFTEGAQEILAASQELVRKERISRRRFYLGGGLGAVIAVWSLLAACRQPETAPPYLARDLSIDPPLSGYCINRFCPNPLSELSFVESWTVTLHDSGEGGLQQGVRSQYHVRMTPSAQLRFTSTRQPYSESAYYIGFLTDYPLDALTGIVNDVTVYEDDAAARDAFESRSGGGQLLTQAGELDLVGYDQGALDVDSTDTVGLRLRRGETVISLQGEYSTYRSDYAAELRGAAETGVIRAMAMLLARADGRADPMTLSGQIYLNGRLLPEEEGVEGINFLQGHLGPYRVVISEFDSSPGYTIEIQGTQKMKDSDITMYLDRGRCSRCAAREQLSFEPGRSRTIDLHFESN